MCDIYSAYKPHDGRQRRVVRDHLEQYRAVDDGHEDWDTDDILGADEALKLVGVEAPQIRVGRDLHNQLGEWRQRAGRRIQVEGYSGITAGQHLDA